MTERPHIELVRATELAGNVPYAYAAIVHNASEVVFTAGACPLDMDGHVVCVGDVSGQAGAAIKNLDTALRAARASLIDVVKTTVYVASNNRDDLVAAWRVISEAFGDHDVPSTLVGVAMLGYPDQHVDIEAIAVTR
jgi:enamine deaminase RidA (YjgF/YER057c/UK114 family)